MAEGLENYRQRLHRPGQYDAQLGRWVVPDPAHQFASPYGAMNNNWPNGVDPDGRFFGTIFTAAVDFFRTGFTKGGFEFWNWGSQNFRTSWREYDPTRSGSRTNNAFKIDMGMFQIDENRKTFVGKIFPLISRLTWELPQTILGNSYSHIRNAAGAITDVSYYGGATLVNRNSGTRRIWGLTLGSYINSKNVVADPFANDIFRHEYGHTLQSRLIGPSYFLKVGIPSFIGSFLQDIGINDHNREWYETQANRMALRYFQNHEPNALVTDPLTGRGRTWNFADDPTRYNPSWYWMFAHPPLASSWWLLF